MKTVSSFREAREYSRKVGGPVQVKLVEMDQFGNWHDYVYAGGPTKFHYVKTEVTQ